MKRQSETERGLGEAGELDNAWAAVSPWSRADVHDIKRSGDQLPASAVKSLTS